MAKPRHIHQQWSVPAEIIEWTDGDTVNVVIEYLPYKWIYGKVRAARINAPEIRADGGLEAKNYASTLLPPGTIVRLTSSTAENFDRVLAEIWHGGSYFGNEDRNFSDEMLASGHAVEYGKKTGIAFQP